MIFFSIYFFAADSQIFFEFFDITFHGLIKIRFVNLCVFFACLVFGYFKLNLSISQNPNS